MSEILQENKPEKTDINTLTKLAEQSDSDAKEYLEEIKNEKYNC